MRKILLHWFVEDRYYSFLRMYQVSASSDKISIVIVDVPWSAQPYLCWDRWLNNRRLVFWVATKGERVYQFHIQPLIYDALHLFWAYSIVCNRRFGCINRICCRKYWHFPILVWAVWCWGLEKCSFVVNYYT